ncbi:MAG: hypothetical protein O9340_05660 [Cyclobacteriaceae bacterium]|jgi:hypothetical protein|nr:hypothetical protein [Cyclobacteriaceae bacterium]
MLRITTLVGLQILCLHFIAYAQKEKNIRNYQDGIIITLSNDTLHGKINNRSYAKNAVECQFLNAYGEKHNFKPDEIVGYRFNNGKFYISKEVNGAKVFLEYLIQGELNVFYLLDKDKKDVYFLSKDTIPLNQLKYVNKMIEKNGVTKIREQKLFINQINYFTKDYPELTSTINRINEPNHKDLIKTAKKYHEKICKDGKPCVIFENNQKRKILIGFIGTGNHLIDPNYEIDLKEYYTAFSAHVYFQQFRRSERFFVGLGLNVAEQRTIESESNRAKIIESNVQIPLSLNYIHLKNGITPTFTYSFDLNTFLLLQNIQAGLRYQKNELSFFTTVGVAKGGGLLNFYASQINFGFMYKLRRN